jgi:hypothetical protein
LEVSQKNTWNVLRAPGFALVHEDFNGWPLVDKCTLAHAYSCHANEAANVGE